MEKKNLIERSLMDEQEFEDYLEKNRVNITEDFYDKNILHLKSYDAIKSFKSVRRAIRRGHVSLDGYIYPKRPFNNAKHKDNSLNDRKKMIYDKLREKQKRGR